MGHLEISAKNLTDPAEISLLTFGNDTAARHPSDGYTTSSHHRQECEMLEIAQEGELQLPGQQGHRHLQHTVTSVVTEGETIGLLPVSTCLVTLVTVLSACCGHWMCPVVLVGRAETCCLGCSSSLSSCNLHYHNLELLTSA